MLFEVKYAPDQNDEETWLATEQVREKLPKGHWLHNRLLEEVYMAIEMGIPPSVFWGWGTSDQAYVMAAMRIKHLMEGYELHLSKEDSKRG